jgi:hypothetical protein
MISPGIGILGKGQHMLGAELNTKTASLTAVIDDMHNAVCDLDAVFIQGLSPESHRPSSACLVIRVYRYPAITAGSCFPYLPFSIPARVMRFNTSSG